VHGAAAAEIYKNLTALSPTSLKSFCIHIRLGLAIIIWYYETTTKAANLCASYAIQVH